MGRTSDARERLLMSASKLISDKGYNAVGVSEVCNDAGVKKGSFYHFFPSKQQLALAVMDLYWGHLECQLDHCLVKPGGSPVARLRAYFSANREQACENTTPCGKQRGCPLGNLVLELSTQDEVLRARLDDIFARWAGYFETVIAEAVELGELRDCCPKRTASDLISFMEGAILMAKLRNDPGLLDGLGGRALRLIGVPEEAPVEEVTAAAS